MYAPDPLKLQICAVGKRMYEKSLVAANDGNISCRIGEDRVLITPSRVCKGDLTPDMILTVNLDGQLIEGQGAVSTELKMHLSAYATLPDMVGVVHAHPRYATAFAVAGIPLDQLIYPTGFLSLGNVPVAPYGTSATEELARSVVDLLRNGTRVMLLANHGALTCAKSLWDAYYLMESLEHYAAIYYLAKQLGGGRVLDEDERKRLELKMR
jgi:L-fuculose-phosphate aldolase